MYDYISSYFIWVSLYNRCSLHLCCVIFVLICFPCVRENVINYTDSYRSKHFKRWVFIVSNRLSITITLGITYLKLWTKYIVRVKVQDFFFFFLITLSFVHHIISQSFPSSVLSLCHSSTTLSLSFPYRTQLSLHHTTTLPFVRQTKILS